MPLSTGAGLGWCESLGLIAAGGRRRVCRTRARDTRRTAGLARRWARCAAFALTFPGPWSALGSAGEEELNVRLVHNAERSAVARAVGGAVQQLGQPGCQTLLDEFADTSGEPLRTALDAAGLSAPDYLRHRLFFYDAPARLCRGSELAITTPGSHAVFVCGFRFAREAAKDSRHADAMVIHVIHETLHSLGLGENPPSCDHINRRIRALCAGPMAQARLDRIAAPVPVEHDLSVVNGP